MISKSVIIVKYGSKCLVNDRGLDQAQIDGYARKLAALTTAHTLVLVTSGSVAVGKRLWLESGRGAQTVEAQVLASLGSAGVAEAWRAAFKMLGLLSGQVLVTHREIDDPEESSSLSEGINNNASHGVISVVNENDILSVSELKKLTYGGDNDGLAAHLAIRLRATALLLLTSVDGFIVDNAVLKSLKTADIGQLHPHFLAANEEGTGSIESKLLAAKSAVSDEASDVAVFIGNANADYQQILAGQTGTQVIQ